MEAPGSIPTQLPDESPEQDSSSRAAVHEGLTVELTPAPLLKRFLAYCVDWGILGLISYVLILVFAALFGVLFALFADFLSAQIQKVFPQDAAVVLATALLVVVLLLAYLSFVHGYFIYYHFKRGYTPGKSLFALKVISLDGKPLTRGQCILREFLVYFDAGFVFPGLISILATQRRQRLGDLAAGTMVTYSAQTEEKEDYLYITQEEYHMLKDLLVPKPIPHTLAEDYLRFAYKYFITKEVLSTDAQLQRWETRARDYMQNAAEHRLDQQSVLLFFAEYCFQTTRS